MLEKLATHDVETVPTLFALADKCARDVEGRAWHSVPQTGVARLDAVSRDDKKKNNGYERLQVATPTVAATARGWGERNKRPWPQGSNNSLCPVHPNAHHGASECREIIRLVKRISERRKQPPRGGTPRRHRPGKERADNDEVTAGDQELGYQSPEGDLKDVFARDSDSGDDSDRRKKLYIMYGGSWKLTSRRNVNPCAVRPCR
jgi:hypothetical protein